MTLGGRMGSLSFMFLLIVTKICQFLRIVLIGIFIYIFSHISLEFSFDVEYFNRLMFWKKGIKFVFRSRESHGNFCTEKRNNSVSSRKQYITSSLF